MTHLRRVSYRPQQLRRLLLAWMLGVSCVCLLNACTGVPRVVPAPLVFEEQSQKILAIAPLGTPKAEAIQKLTDAGISGEFASSPSIYYCDLWEQENGNRWHMNVALLFNEQGELYKTRPAQADVTWQSAEEAAESEQAAGQATEQVLQ